jgi:uncharacterized C2H2 Zn-finger protein
VAEECICTICGMTFQSEKELEEHVESVHLKHDFEIEEE